MTVYMGIDWSTSSHEVCFMNAAGAVIARGVVPHTADGLSKLDALRQKLGVAPADCLVGIETAYTLLIDFLWARGYTQVYVIPPSVVKSSRGRYGQSGARTDTSDARLLADLLRTDRARLHPWLPDTVLTRQLRNRIGLHSHLTHTMIRLSNRLRAVLLRYYPAVLEVFSGLHVQITLQFLLTYPTPQAANQLTLASFTEFARKHTYRQPGRLPAAFARLQARYPSADAETVTVYAQEAEQLASLVLNVLQARNAQEQAIGRLFRQHPDHDIFASLPGAGDILAPALLAKFGDDRQRFPNAASVQALAGTCPVTDQSGKRRVIKFRTACDRDFRDVVQQWAKASLNQSGWAKAYWEDIRSRGHSDNHAYRCLANRWVAIAWKLWQTKVPYDEEYHLQQRLKRSQPHSPQAG